LTARPKVDGSAQGLCFDPYDSTVYSLLVIIFASLGMYIMFSPFVCHWTIRLRNSGQWPNASRTLV